MQNYFVVMAYDENGRKMYLNFQQLLYGQMPIWEYEDAEFFNQFIGRKFKDKKDAVDNLADVVKAVKNQDDSCGFLSSIKKYRIDISKFCIIEMAEVGVSTVETGLKNEEKW